MVWFSGFKTRRNDNWRSRHHRACRSSSGTEISIVKYNIITSEISYNHVIPVLLKHLHQGLDILNRVLERLHFAHPFSSVVLHGDDFAQPCERRIYSVDASSLPGIPLGDDLGRLVFMRHVFISLRLFFFCPFVVFGRRNSRLFFIEQPLWIHARWYRSRRGWHCSSFACFRVSLPRWY